ncbi:ubiquitin-protein ligase, putative [Trypanosoma brucei brucei TREU927]|uniref:Ubiquitin-protein ligase, putative n=1 Tax=Trypanosoma brucei brucei (strain 927/4 GUTat10.1) TaxID=185431 RepID=Q38D88_TRYB2|nr:ubiquitin-protein ligase, putative [Trypanosoma brucei brucei TREU927]EAN77232.1 ubiquitin-protein ligase, putative [Trypanosoma brucei brucei TREU927]
MSRQLVVDSKQQIKAVQHLSKDPERVVGALEDMCMSLVMGVEVYLRGFDSMRVVPTLVHMAESERFFRAGDALTMIFRALSLIMEHVPTSYCGVHPYHKRLVRIATEVLARVHSREMRFSNLDRVMLMEEVLRLIRFVTLDESSVSLVHLGLRDVTKTAQYENALLTRQALDVLLAVCSKVVLPSETRKRKFFSSVVSLFSCCKSLKDEQQENKPCVKPSVVTTDHILVPFLQGMIQQYASSLESSPDSWSLLELALQCLGMLIRRAVLFNRLSSAQRMITSELCRCLYRLLLLNDGNVALDPSVRSERLLFSETMIDIILTADWVNVSDMLLSKEARAFYGIVLDDSDPSITMLLSDPFPVGGISRAAHRRDKNHIVSIAAIRHFILASPPLPSEAFGPKPKVVLPVHKWMWEDEMRHNSPIPEEACVTLETCLARRTKEVTLRIHSKILTANLATMKICSGFGGAELNISRKFVPFVFHVMNEADIRSVKAAKDVTGVVEYIANSAEENIGVPISSGMDKLVNRRESELCRYYVLNNSAPVPAASMKIAEMYLESLCKYATWASGSMAMQLGVCACAALLQAAILAKKPQQLTELLRKTMRPLCDMLRTALISADKATKSVALTMMVWLLRHPGSSEWKAAETAYRCGVVKQLENLANSKCKRLDDRQADDQDGKIRRMVPKVKLEGPENRTMHLMAMVRAILSTVEKEMSENSVPPSARSHVGCVTALWESVQELRKQTMVFGTHQKVVAQVLRVMEKTSGNITAFEISKMGIADAVLGYLLMSNTGGDEYDTNEEIGATCAAESSGALISEGVVPGLTVDTGTDPATFGGVRIADQLKRLCQKDRLKCFLQLMAEYPRGVEALIENLVSALCLISNLPFVESLMTSQRVTCVPLTKAMSAVSQLSQDVSLCRKTVYPSSSGNPCRRGVSHDRGRNQPCSSLKSGDIPSSTPSQRAVSQRGSKLTVRESCPNGHLLLSLEMIAPKRSCESCEEQLETGFGCNVCNYFLCVSCHSHFITSRDGGATGRRSSSFNGVAAGAPDTVVQPKSRVNVATSAHLFSSIGDIERTFRTDSNSTKGTEVAPCPQSTLAAEVFLERVQLVLSRKKETMSYVELRQELQRLIDGFIAQRETIESLDELDAHNKKTPVDLEEPSRLERMLHDAMEDRYVLYTSPTGRCAYQETLMGNIMQRALNLGLVDVVGQLESCLVTPESHGEPLNLGGGEKGLSKTLLLLRGDIVNGEVPPSATEDKEHITSWQLNRFHHFESDAHTHCCCGLRSREELNTAYPSKLVRKPSHLSQSPDVLLLILLHKILQPLMVANTIPINPDVFVSAILTTQLVKSVAASALRIALLPPRIAVPRWVDFILTEAKFLVPPSVREDVVRFLAYGARRALHANIRSSMGSRRYRMYKVYPSEWSKYENHKYVVSRNDLLHGAYMVLRKGAECRAPISIQFKGEVGIGQGPTAHFYTLIARELTKCRLRLWNNSSRSSTTHESGDSCGNRQLRSKSNSGTFDDEQRVESRPEGLFPCSSVPKVLQRFSTDLSLSSCRDTKALTERFLCMNDFFEVDEERAQLYYLVGTVLGRAFTDAVVFPLDISPALALFLCRGIPPSRIVLRCTEKEEQPWEPERPIDFMSLGIEEVEMMDKQVASSLRSLLSMSSKELSSLDLPFTMPGDDRFEMIDKGQSTCVNSTNVSAYIRRAASALLYESVVMPIRFITYGFRDVVPCEALAALDASEAMSLLCGNRIRDSEPLWTAAEIKSIIVPDHGYNSESPQITMLQNILAKRFGPREQRAFLLFCTGCPRLPHGGISALGAITVVQSTHMPTLPDASHTEGNGKDGSNGGRKGGDRSRRISRTGNGTKAVGIDWPLPSVNTCFRYLKMPPYPTEELMYNKLQLSIMYAGDTFELS